MKCLGLNLTKYIRDLYTENYQTLLTENKDLSKRRETMFMNCKNQY